jgi:hypothetical protein
MGSIGHKLAVESFLHYMPVDKKFLDIQNDVEVGLPLTSTQWWVETVIIYQIQLTPSNASFTLV